MKVRTIALTLALCLVALAVGFAADNPNIAFAPQLNINIADTPEPATFILLAVGAVGMAGYGSVAAAFPHFTDGNLRAA